MWENRSGAFDRSVKCSSFMFRFVLGRIINEDLKGGGDEYNFMIPLKGSLRRS